jgi:hypothetical protein
VSAVCGIAGFVDGVAPGVVCGVVAGFACAADAGVEAPFAAEPVCARAVPAAKQSAVNAAQTVLVILRLLMSSPSSGVSANGSVGEPDSFAGAVPG